MGDQEGRARSREIGSTFVSDREGLIGVKGHDDLLVETLREITPQHPELARLGVGQLVTDA